MDKALENDIKIFMASRIAEGISLSDIQNEVNEKFQLSMTYMDIRILAAGLDIDWQAKAAAKAEKLPKKKPLPQKLPQLLLMARPSLKSASSCVPELLFPAP